MPFFLKINLDSFNGFSITHVNSLWWQFHFFNFFRKWSTFHGLQRKIIIGSIQVRHEISYHVQSFSVLSSDNIHVKFEHEELWSVTTCGSLPCFLIFNSFPSSTWRYDVQVYYKQKSFNINIFTVWITWN